jgi:hypothetical protein
MMFAIYNYRNEPDRKIFCDTYFNVLGAGVQYQGVKKVPGKSVKN